MSKNTVIVPEEENQQRETTVAISRGGAAQQNTLRNVRLITGREFKNRVMQRAFIISSIIMLVLTFLGTCVPTVIDYIASRSSGPAKLTVVNAAGTIGGMNETQLTQYIQASLNGSNQGQQGSAPNTTQKERFTITSASEDANALQKTIKDGKQDVGLIIQRNASQDLTFTTYASSDDHATEMQTLANQLNVLDRSSRLGLTPQQTNSLFAPADFKQVNTAQNQDQRSGAERAAGFILAYIGIVLIFMSVFLYGMGVATGVAEEKGSRIMEILVNAATPFQLLVGKILGIGASGLLQMSSFVLVGILGFLIQPLLRSAVGLPSNASVINFDLTGASINLLLIILLFFILGFLLYSTLFAAVGALVKRQDEVQSAAQPLTWLFMIGYIASFIGIGTPDALWVRIISYIPFWTPTTMLMRIGSGNVAAWEVWMSLGLMVIAIFICSWIGSRIYRYGILMYGQRPNMAQLVKVLFSRN